MKFRKTPQSQRSTYTYTFYDADGFERKLTLRPGENGITEMDIKMLHSMDDAEVYSNLKNAKPPVMPWDKEWNLAHPYEERHKNYTVSLDALYSEEDGEDTSDRLLALAVEDEKEEQLQLVRDIVATFPEEQRLLYHLLYIEGYSAKHVAKMYGVTVQAIYKRALLLKERIKKNINNF